MIQSDIDKISQVILPECTDSMFVRPGSLDPQRIMVRHNNTATIYINTTDKRSEDKADIVFTTGTIPGNLARGVRRIGLTKFSIIWTIPNVNERNNTLTLYSSVTSSLHTVTIPEGHYMLPSDLINAIVSELNTITGTTGLTFAATAVSSLVPYVSNRYNIAATGGTFYFDPTCSMIAKGEPLWAPPISSTLVSSIDTGYINLKYTNYITIHSDALTRYVKLGNMTDNPFSNNNLIDMFMIDDSSKFDKADNPCSIPYGLLTKTPSSDGSTNWINYNASQTINIIDVRLLDQFGQELYIGEQNGFDYFLELTIQGA